MAKSLQEQLLKAGLVNAHKAKQIKHEKHKQTKQPQTQADEAKRLAQLAQAEKAERDREISRQQQLDIERKAIAAQIKQLIEQYRVECGNGDIAYQFTDDSKVKKLYITEAQRSQLARGQLAIVKYETRYELVPAVAAEKIRDRVASAVLVLNAPQTHPPEKQNDPYADFQVPDDLMW